MTFKQCCRHIWFCISWLPLHCVLCILVGKQVFTRWHFKPHVCPLFKSSRQEQVQMGKHAQKRHCIDLFFFGETWVACLSIHVVVVIYQLNINWWSNSTLSAFEFLPGPKLAMKLGKFVPNHVWATICQIVFGTLLKHTDLEQRRLLMIQWHFHNHPD